MSEGELLFFLLFLGLQLIYPTWWLIRVHLLGRGDIVGHNTSPGRWDMMIRSIEENTRFWIYHTKTRAQEEIPLENILLPSQRMHLRTTPADSVPFAKWLAARLKEQGLEDFEIRALYELDINMRGPQEMNDCTIDISSEPLMWLNNYPWIRWRG